MQMMMENGAVSLNLGTKMELEGMDRLSRKRSWLMLTFPLPPQQLKQPLQLLNLQQQKEQLLYQVIQEKEKIFPIKLASIALVFLLIKALMRYKKFRNWNKEAVI